MRHHVGTDIIEIHRIAEAIEQYGERFLKRVYTGRERAFCGTRAHSLAASFASNSASACLRCSTGGPAAWPASAAG